MPPTTGLLVRQVLLDIRHPAWTPVNPDGSTPVLAGTGAVAPNGWQPIATGQAGRVDGVSPNTVTYRGDNGLMVKLSPFDTQDKIEDHTGDGDSVAQMVSHRFETLQNRTLSFDWDVRVKWIPRFVWAVFDDPTKRPFEIRERFVALTAVSAAVNLTAGYAAGVSGKILADGTGLTSMAVDDLITFGTTTTPIYRLVRVDADGIVLDRPLAALVADNAAIERAAITKTIQAEYYVSTPGIQREATGILGQTVELVPTGVFTRTGMAS